MLAKFGELVFSRIKATEFYFRATYDPERDGTEALARLLEKADAATMGSYEGSCGKFWLALQERMAKGREPGWRKGSLAKEIAWHFCGMQKAWEGAPEAERAFLEYCRDNFEPADFAFKSNWIGPSWEEHRQRYLGYWFSDVLARKMLALEDAADLDWADWIAKAAKLRPEAFGAALDQSFCSEGFLGIHVKVADPSAGGLETLFALAGSDIRLRELLDAPCGSERQAQAQIAAAKAAEKGGQPGPKLALLSKWLVSGEVENLAAWSAAFGAPPEKIGPYPVGLVAALRPDRQQSAGWLLGAGTGPGHFGADGGQSAWPEEDGGEAEILGKAASQWAQRARSRGMPFSAAGCLLAGADGCAVLARMAAESREYALWLSGLWKSGTLGPRALLESAGACESKAALLEILESSGAVRGGESWTVDVFDGFVPFGHKFDEDKVRFLELLAGKKLFCPSFEEAEAKMFGGLSERALAWPAVALALGAGAELRKKWQEKALQMFWSRTDMEILESNAALCAAHEERRQLNAAAREGRPSAGPRL